MFDTIKGGDYLVDQDAAEVLAREAIETVIELEHMGLPFNRTPDGKIDQRRFGGHTRNYGEGPVKRACFAADRTGHMILQTLYQQCLKHGVKFYDEYHVVDLVTEGGDLGAGGRAAGVVAYRIADGELVVLRSKAVLLATGGFGRMFRVTSNAWSLTGDGVSLAYRHGVPLQDMEFYQFHPTGIVGIGILLSEAARGEGAYLLDNDGFRFMERYAPKLMELAPRDMVSRAIVQEIRAGRGIDGKDYVYLDVRHLGRKVIDEKLPDITDFVRVYQGIEPYTDPIPIQPTAHYAMGGVPDQPADAGDPRRGEHGRPGPVRGRRGGLRVRPRRQPPGHELAGGPAGLRPPGRPPDGASTSRASRCRTVDPSVIEPVRAEIEAIRTREGGERAAAIRTELADVMMDDVGVYRDETALTRARDDVAALKERYANVSVARQGHRVQHGPPRGARAGLPARLRRDDGRRRARPQGEPRRAQPRGLPGPGRRELPDPLPRDEGRGRDRAGLQAGDDHPVPAQAAHLLSGGETDADRAAHPPLRPGEGHQAPRGDVPGRGRSHGPGPGPAAQGQVRAGRHADVPPVVRARRLRLGRDADQRAQPPRLQDPGRPAGRQEDHGGAAARACR